MSLVFGKESMQNNVETLPKKAPAKQEIQTQNFIGVLLNQAIFPVIGFL